MISCRRFAEFDLAHPEVWALYKKYTFELIRRGFDHHSSDFVLHRVRWETASVLDDESSIKINNNWSAFYARKFRDEHPKHADFFRLRSSWADAA